MPVACASSYVHVKQPPPPAPACPQSSCWRAILCTSPPPSFLQVDKAPLDCLPPPTCRNWPAWPTGYGGSWTAGVDSGAARLVTLHRASAAEQAHFFLDGSGFPKVQKQTLPGIRTGSEPAGHHFCHILVLKAGPQAGLGLRWEGAGTGRPGSSGAHLDERPHVTLLEARVYLPL